MEEISWIISERIARGRSYSESTITDNRYENFKNVPKFTEKPGNRIVLVSRVTGGYNSTHLKNEFRPRNSIDGTKEKTVPRSTKTRKKKGSTRIEPRASIM